MTLHRAYTEALEAALAEVIADAKREMATVFAEHRAEVAECKAQLATAKAEVADLRAALMGHTEALVARAVETLPRPEPVDLSGLVSRAELDEQVRALDKNASDLLRRVYTLEERPEPPAAPEQKDWQPQIEAVSQVLGLALDERADDIQRQIDRLTERPGTFPAVKAWSDDGVSYAGALVTHDGALWQAQRDTGKAPGHDDWRCIVEKGEQGFTGRSIVHRGTYDAAVGYVALDAVTLNGSTFLATEDHPGPCPGEGWQLMASRGSRGAPGERGQPGRDGASPPEVAAFHIDVERDLAVLTLSNGATHEADLYPLLAKVAK